MQDLIVYGNGGHARVVQDVADKLKIRVATIFDDNASQNDERFRQYHPDVYANTPLIIAIGNNGIRKAIANAVAHSFATLIHPTAAVAATAVIGAGTVVLAHAIIQAGAVIGRHVIINAGVCVDHDAVIGDYAHIYPNAYIAGGALVKAETTVAPNTVIARNSAVGDNRHL